MRMEGMGNLFGYEKWGITCGGKGLGKIGGVGEDVIREAADSPPWMAIKKGVERLVVEAWQLDTWRY